MKASAFDQKFDGGEDITTDLELSRARNPQARTDPGVFEQPSERQVVQARLLHQPLRLALAPPEEVRIVRPARPGHGCLPNRD